MRKCTQKSFIKVLAAICFAVVLFSAVMVMSVSAEEEKGYFYVSAKGDDNNNATSPKKAVATFTQACRRAVNANVDVAYIVIIDEYSVQGGVPEIKHEDTLFVVTTRDDTTDYASTNGAKFTMGKQRRYELAGDTTFENIAIEYTGSVNFVAKYNHITFGENVTITRLDEGACGVWVVGGWQSPEDTFDTDLDSHITIKSGSFSRVAGGSRQKASNSTGKIVFTGTHTIEVSGGEIDALYGSSIVNNYSNSANITVTGGKINTLNVAGDATRRLNGDAVVTLTGGTIDKLNVNNVLGNATVTLAGAKIGALAIIYGSDAGNGAEVSKLETQAKKTKTLYYDANYYTPEEIERFSKAEEGMHEYGEAFNVVENITTVYAKSGATGSGATENDPTTFENAFARAAQTNSVVCVIGSIAVDNFTEPAHSGTVIVKGKGGALEFTGTYTLSGKTEYKDIKLSGNAKIDATKGNLVVASNVDVASKFDIIGSAELRAGSYATITGASNVFVENANVESIVGGTEKFTLEIAGGTVGAVSTTATSIKDVQISVTGGEVGSIEFKNITKSLAYVLYGGKVGTHTTSGKNVKGTLQLETSLFSESDLGAAASLFTVDETKVVFVAGNGKGNGTSAVSALGNFKDAYNAIGNADGTIVVCGSTKISSSFIAPKHTGKITVTSVYDGVDYSKTNGAEIALSANFICGGDTVIDNITINCQKNYSLVVASYCNVVFGKGITCKYSGNSTTYPSIAGGYYADIKDVSGNVTVNGGNWARIRLGNYTNLATNADLTFTFNAGTVHEYVVLGSNKAHVGNLSFVMNGGTINRGISGTIPANEEFYYNGDISVTLNGGTVYGKVNLRGNTMGTFSGNWNVVINGGDLSHITEISGTEGLGVDMKSNLFVSENVGVNEKLTGTHTFTNPIRNNGADPWVFFHDGNYYYISTGGSVLKLYRAANFGDLKLDNGTTIYDPESGHEWSTDLWSPEIHYFSKEEVGEKNAGWYCFLSSQPDDEYLAANPQPKDVAGFGNQRAYVIKCLDGDNLFGRWGHPVTGEVNVPQKLTFTKSDHNVKEFTSGCSVIRINGQVYLTFVSEVGRETAGTEKPNFYQTINIAKLTNPWTVDDVPTVICKPDYDWEKHGSEDKIHPQVVEGTVPIYGDNGEVFLIYTGSGYWTTFYELGQMKFLGGDPKDVKNWEKKPTPILSKSQELNGCGHASRVTDTSGQGWLVYHAYTGTTTSSGRAAYAEPYYIKDGNVVIGNGSTHPESPKKVYNIPTNSTPIGEKISGFTKTETIKEKFAFVRTYDNLFTDVKTTDWYYSYVKNAYRLKLANGMSATKFAPNDTFTVAQALTVAANIHTAYTGKSVAAAAAGEQWYDPYIKYCVENGIITASQFKNYTANITRGEMAIVFANILPDSEYEAMRDGMCTDITEDMACYEAVSKLYKAGIVGGDAGTGKYRPNDSLKRSEACVIFSRIAMKTVRDYK